MRHLPLVCLAVVAPALPFVIAAPASAGANVICVNIADPSCTPGQGQPTIPLAIDAANANTLDDVVLVGPGTYSDGPYQLNGSIHAITLKGSGQGATTLTLADNVTQQTYVSLQGAATLEDLTVSMAPGTNSSNDTAIGIDTGIVTRVSVTGTGTTNAKGVSASNATISDSSFLLPTVDPQGNEAVYVHGGNTVTDTVATGWRAVAFGNDNVATESISRVRLTASEDGVFSDGGTLVIDDALIDLGTSQNAVGIHLENTNTSTKPMTVNADHVTIVGGAAGSRGVKATAASDTAQQHTTVQLDNSIVRGPEIPLQAIAGHSGNVAQVSTATISASYSDWASASSQVSSLPGGTAAITPGAGVLDDVDPQFVNPAGGNYQLSPGSPVIDVGDPVVGGPATDLLGHQRVIDGDAVPGAVGDLGAYEFGDFVAPDTLISSGPAGPTDDATPTFAFTSEPGATFKCTLDSGLEAACTSPFTTPVLTDGPHSFSVRAEDAAHNVDATPATRSFTVDTVAPDTSISAGPSGRTNDATPTFGFASEAGATFKCTIDGAAEAACTSPFTAPALSDGAHTFTVRATDAAGNPDLSPVARTFTVDTVAPETAVSKKPAKRTMKRKVKIAFTSEAGATFECRVDRKAWKPCSSPLKVRVKVGRHTVLVRATDAAGNVDPSPVKVRFTRVSLKP